MSMTFFFYRLYYVFYRRLKLICELNASVTVYRDPVRWRRAGKPCQTSKMSVWCSKRNSTVLPKFNNCESVADDDSYRSTLVLNRTRLMIWFILPHRQISANMIWELVQWVLTEENVTEHRKLSTDVSYFAAEGGITHTWKPLLKDAAVNSTGAVM